jgi:NurA domain
VSEKSSWSDLPFDLQEEFYRLSESTAQDLAKHIQDIEREISAAWPQVEFAVKPISENSRNELSIASVDGSRSPEPTKRLGGDFAVYSAGLLRLKGKNIIENRFGVGKADSVQAQKVELASLVSAKALAAEREVAVAALKDSDLVLVDGSFYGFSGEVTSVLRRRGESAQQLGEWSEAIRATLKRTAELVDSGKCIGVIKRSHTRAISGWLSVRNGKTVLKGLTDKYVLSRKLASSSHFDYSTLPGEESYLTYSMLAYNLGNGREKEPTHEALGRAAELATGRFTKAFERPFGVRVESSKLRRTQVRMYRVAPPCELEVPASVPAELVEDLLSPGNFSEATGLPHGIDMIDEYVGIPRAFTRDFVYEVEARITSLAPSSLDGVRGFFTGLNPQKEGIE